MNPQKVIFCTQAYNYLRDKILLLNTDIEKGKIEIISFPDKEIYHRIENNLENKHAIIIGGTIDDSNTLELYDLAIGCEQLGAAKLTIIIPYFGYSTMERAIKFGEIVKAKTRAILFSSIPRTAGGNEIILLDLHTEGLPYYFESNIRPIHIYAKTIIQKACNDIAGKDFVLASTDAGRAKWVESLANDMQVEAAFILKRRINAENTEVTTISAQVKDKVVIIYDDMLRTGGSIIKAAKAYQQEGAKEIYVIITHGVCVDGSIESLKNSGYIKKLILTDSHPKSNIIENEFVKIYSIAELLCCTIL